MVQRAIHSGNTLWATSLSLWAPVAAYGFSCSGKRGGRIPWRETLYALPCPKTFVFGGQTLPDPDETELRRHGVRVEIIPNVGHSMAWENPLDLAETVERAILSAP
jgi:pimeloyl-ACP methyl ester carboxylesterase